jgi:hypothetical protein
MNPNNIKQRLTRDTNYKPTGDSYQSTLSIEEIDKKLNDYIKVDSSNIYKIPLNTHIRYFTINPKTGEKLFRLGGFLSKFGDNNEYIILANNNFTWPVQLSNSIIFKKLLPNELREKVESEVNHDVKKQMKKLIKENQALKDVIKQIKETTLVSKSQKKK